MDRLLGVVLVSYFACGCVGNNLAIHSTRTSGLPRDACSSKVARASAIFRNGEAMKKLTVVLMLLTLACCLHRSTGSYTHPLGAPSGGDRASTIPLSWTVSNWYFDYTNSTTCASDNNNCTSASCGGTGSFVGPCVTYAEVVSRWGTYRPRLRQNTTLTWLSSQSGNNDPVYFDPYIENGSYAWITAPLGPALWSTTLSSVVEKARGTPQLLQANLGASAATLPTGGVLLVNATHPSRAWTIDNVSGTTYTISQPEAVCTPLSCPAVGEVDTWTNGDVVAAYTPIGINIVELQPIVADPLADAGTTGEDVPNGYLAVGPITWLAPGYVGSDEGNQAPAIVNGYVQTFDSLSFRNFSSVAASQGMYLDSGSVGNYWYNHQFYSRFLGGSTSFYGGDLYNYAAGSIMFNVNISDDLVVHAALRTYGTLSYVGQSNGTGVYVLAPKILSFNGGEVGISGPIWGTGAVLFNAGTVASYPAGATGATDTFLTPLYLNENTTGCSQTGTSPVTVSCGIPLSGAALDAPAGPAGFGGSAFVLGGGRVSNVTDF